MSQVVYDGQGWREDPGRAREMFAVFEVVRHLHELLWYLDEAAGLPVVPPLRADLEAVRQRIDALTRSSPAPILDADLAGRRLPGHLRGADLRGSVLIATDLSGSDLRSAGLLGADLRDADLSGADLGGCLFLTQRQIDAARGDAATALPGRLRRPDHRAA